MCQHDKPRPNETGSRVEHHLEKMLELCEDPDAKYHAREALHLYLHE